MQPFLFKRLWSAQTPSIITIIYVIEIHQILKGLKTYLCRYVSEFLGKSKLITTFTEEMSIPRVNRSERETLFYQETHFIFAD